MLATERCVLTIQHGTTRHKIAQVQWELGPKGIDYFAHLAYFTHEKWILSKYKLEGPAGTSTRQDLDTSGQTTRNRVKFTHHSDGEAHFSGNRKVFTRVRNQTRPLSDYIGHVFTIGFWGLDSFLVAAGRDMPRVTPKRSVVDIGWAKDEREAKDISGDVVGFLVPFNRIRELWLAASPQELTQPDQMEEG
ncbi:MAG: hypothetical protein ACRDJH_18570 [Thermomicrobiales bacterium]